MGAKVPDFRGLFLRGQGGNAASLGVQQGDAIRNIVGHVNFLGRNDTGFQSFSGSGAFDVSTSGRYFPPTGNVHEWGNLLHGFTFDISRVVPTAEENRPVNRAVRYLIRAAQ